MTDQEVYDLAIVGAGPTGLFGAFYARMRELKTIVVDALPEHGGQLTALYPEKYVYDVPGFSKILAKDLAEKLWQQAQSEWVSWNLGQKIDLLQREGDYWRVGSAEAQSYVARAVILTTGVGSFSPHRIGIPNEEKYEGKGLFYFAKNFSEFKDKDVIVVGGGDSAVDWAQSLYEDARSLKLIHRRGDFRAHEASIKKLQESTVEIIAPGKVTALHGSDELEKVTIERTDGSGVEEVPCQKIILALGFKSDLGPIVDWDLDMVKSKVLVNVRCETNQPGIYAAGDISVNPDLGNLKLMVVGFGQVAVAVSNAHTWIDPKSRIFAGHSSSMKSFSDKKT